MLRSLPILLLLALCGRPLTAEPGWLAPVKLQLKWYHQFQFAGYYAALEKGYYREAGLDVEIREGVPAVPSADAVISGEAQYGVSNMDILIQRSRGRNLVALAAIFQHSPDMLMVLEDSGIRVPSDLAGKTLMVVPEAEVEILSMLREEAVPQETLTLIPHTWNPEDLVSGKVDAMSAYTTNEPLLLRNRGIRVTEIHPRNYGIDFYGDCLFTTESEIQRNPGRVRSFLEASIRGWEYALQHPGEIADLIREKYSTRKSRQELLDEAAAMRELIVPDLVPIGFMNPGRWRHIRDIFAARGALPRDFPLEGFLYDPDRPRIDPRVVRAGIGAAAVVLAAALLYILALRSFNRRLAVQVAARTASLRETNRRLEEEISRGAEREGRLAASLSEKEVLLREIHHRVKNNLQIIVSILNLQSEKGNAEFLRELRGRVVGMALVHEHLYSGRNLDRVDMENYLEDLVSDIVSTYSRPDLFVRTEVEAPGISLSIDQAVPLGLIVAELVSNSMKHGFSGRNSGLIRLSLTEETGGYLLTVLDDGTCTETLGGSEGAPGSSGLGLRLVEALAAQLRGRLEVECGGGYRTSLRFPCGPMARP